MNPSDLKFWLGYLSEWLGVIAVVMIAGTSPMLKKIRRIEFRYPRREATFALIFFALIFFFAFLFSRTGYLNLCVLSPALWWGVRSLCGC